MVEKGRLGEKAVVKKINHFNSFSNEITKVFAKEARSLSTTDNKNIVKLLGVSEAPLATMIEYLSFLFCHLAGLNVSVLSINRCIF